MITNYFKRKIAILAILSLFLNVLWSLNINLSYRFPAWPTWQIDNISDSFLSTFWNVSLSNLTVWWAYVIMNWANIVSSWALIADNNTWSLSLNPSYFTNYWNYTLTLSWTYWTTNWNLSTVSLYVWPVDYQDLYVNQVSPTLNENWIITNLWDVTYANVNSFSGLYFEKTWMWKIYFSNSLDLTNSWTIAFLQDLPNKLDISDWNINFNPSNSDFANYWAQLYMYFNTWSTFIAWINNPDSFVVRSSTGQIIDASWILSNIHWACWVWDPYCTLFFDTAHFTSFDLKPILTDVSIISDNASWSLAKTWDTMTISFTWSENLTWVSVSFNWEAAANIEWIWNIWTASSNPIVSWSWIVSFVINYSDLTWNTWSTIATTDWTSILLDTTEPIINSKQIKNITENSADFEFNFSENNFIWQDWSIQVYSWEMPQGPYSISFSWSTWNVTFDWLNSNTSYSYYLSLTDDAWNNTISNWTFSTAAWVSWTWEIAETWSVSFGFTWALSENDNYDLSGTNLTINSDLNDTNALTWNLSLSWINIIVSSWSWNWILIPPTLIDPNSSEAATWSEIWIWISVIQTIKAWAEWSSLSSSWWYFNVSFIVDWYSSWTILNLYRSENWNSWALNTPDSTCTLDANSMCSFRTDHMSYFAPWFDSVPDNFSFTNLTSKELSTIYESNTITVSWINTWTTISIVGWEYKIWNWSYTSNTWTVNNWDTVSVRLTSSSSSSTAKTTTLTIWWVSAWFSVTTKASSGGGGGGGWASIKDYCPAWDQSASFYDGICWKAKGQTWTWVILDKPNLNKHYVFMDLENSFSKSYIEVLQNKWAIKIYSGRLFVPDKKITRAEFLALAMKSLDINLTSTWTNSFTDIPKNWDWMIPYIIKAKELGIIKGQTENWKLQFKPNQPISRIEALAILFKLTEITKSDDKVTEFEDSDFQDWMIGYVKKAKDLKIIAGQSENWKLKFKPNSSITRAEAAKIIVKFINIVN